MRSSRNQTTMAEPSRRSWRSPRGCPKRERSASDNRQPGSGSMGCVEKGSQKKERTQTGRIKGQKDRLISGKWHKLHEQGTCTADRLYNLVNSPARFEDSWRLLRRVDPSVLGCRKKEMAHRAHSGSVYRYAGD